MLDKLGKTFVVIHPDFYWLSLQLLLADLKKCMEAMNNRETFMSYGKNYVRSK